MSKKDDEIYVEVVTKEKIPLLAAVTTRSVREIEHAYYAAHARGTVAWILMTDPKTWKER